MAADRRGAGVRAALDDLFARGNRATTLRRAARWLADGEAIARLLDPVIGRLERDPFHVPPLRVSRDRARQSAVLFEAPHVRVVANVIAARAGSPTGIVLTGQSAITRYHRAGGVRLRRWRRDTRRDRLVEIDSLVPADGEVVAHDGRREAQMMVGAACDIVTVSVIARDTVMPLIREYDAADGRLVRLASGDDGEARRLLLMTMLRAMRRTDAAPVFAGATHAAAHHVRWSAMREWLALDARTAWPRLAELAAHDGDADVRRAATATLARVQLCPA